MIFTTTPTAPPELEKLSGRIERLTFTNEDNGYTVMIVKVPGQRQPVTAVGCLADPQVGELVEMEGHYVQNSKYGSQFQVVRHRLIPPGSKPALKKYLGSGLIKGVGPVLAGRLVEHFGAQVLDILENSPERLIEVSGLGVQRREIIIGAWQRTQGLKRLLTFLAEFGLGPSIGLRVLRRLGDQAETLIRQNPYRLAYEIEGVGFATADKVAQTLGLAPDAPQRLEAGLIYTLNQEADEGHSYTATNLLVSETKKLVAEADSGALHSALGRLILEGLIKSENPTEPDGEVDCFPPRLKRAEDWIARDLLALAHTAPLLEVPRPEAALAWAQKTLGLNLSPSQLIAARQALDHKLLVITGGPGTGKTTITRVITTIFGAIKARIALAAPTGRAARRLSEATGLPAKTIHRLLEYAPQAGGFQRGPKNKLDIDLLLLDEASMVDLSLMNQLTGALPSRARLIMVGDQDQLPSVGPGRVLGDILESGVAAVACLNEIHRQAEGSQIIRAAHQINQGIFPESSQDKFSGDFFILEEKDSGQLLEKLLYLITKRLPEKLGLSPMDIQVLTPMHLRDLGTEHLNQVLSKALNLQGGRSLMRFGRTFKQGDRVMQLRNNYQREVFNGDTGVIKDINFESQELIVDFDGRLTAYDFSDTDELNLAYAITIHKSQGSEFEVVLIPLALSQHIMLRRRLLYTAVTRGRQFVVILGPAEAIRRAVTNNQEKNRRSHLIRKLRGL